MISNRSYNYQKKSQCGTVRPSRKQPSVYWTGITLARNRAVPSVQQLIQWMLESVIPAKTFPARVFGVFLWRLKNFSDYDQVSVQPCCLQLALIANTKARITKLPILWRLSKRSQYDRVMNVCSCNWQQTQREEITILKLKTKRSVWPSQ